MQNKIGSFVKAIGGFLVLSSLSISLMASVQAAPGMAKNTKPPLQIIAQTGLKVVVQVNYADTLPNGIGKQVLATKTYSINIQRSECSLARTMKS